MNTEKNTGDYIVETAGLTKSFGSTVANSDVSLRVNRGGLHALLGENGAGKTTLLNLIYGLLRPDKGDILLFGEKVTHMTSTERVKNGVYMVAQNLSVIPKFTVYQNIMALPTLSGEETKKANLEARVREVTKDTGLEVDISRRVEELAMGERQRVEVIRALISKAKVLLLDEPTSVLTPQESEGLFKLLKSLASGGMTVVIAVHKLDEVINYCDFVTVLRHGEVVSNRIVAETNKDELAHDILGSVALERSSDYVSKLEKSTRLSLVGISGGRRGLLTDLTIEIKRGEIVGVAAVSGNGQDDLGLIASGRTKLKGGRILVDNEEMTRKNTMAFLKKGVSFIPDDGAASGIVPDMTVAENILARWYVQESSLTVSEVKYGNLVDQIIERFDIRPPNKNVRANLLSGGNLQKVLVAREVSGNPSILVAINPTKGLDIRSQTITRNAMSSLKESGCSVLLISEDLPELFSLSDRLLCMHRGKIVGEWSRGNFDVNELGLKMTGG